MNNAGKITPIQYNRDTTVVETFGEHIVKLEKGSLGRSFVQNKLEARERGHRLSDGYLYYG